MTVPTPSGGDLLTLAAAILDGTAAVPRGRAPRAAAAPARQALEEAVDARCAVVAPGLDRPSMRSRLILLRVLDDETIGQQAQVAWDGLSRACHHHAYELQPSALDVRELIRIVRSVERPDGIQEVDI